MKRLVPVLIFTALMMSSISCAGGGSSSPSGPTPPNTAASIAPSLGLEINSSFIAAMGAGVPLALRNSGRVETFLVRLFESLVSQPMSAQTGYVSACSRGGTVRIQYQGATPLGRSVTLVNTSVVYSSCAHSLNGRDITANGTLTANGTWTALAPMSPVRLSGDLTVNEVGIVAVDGSTGTVFSGQVGGTTIGTPAPAPTPTPAPAPVSTFNGTYSGTATGTQTNLDGSTGASSFRLTPVVTDGVIAGTLSTPPEAEVQGSIPLSGTLTASGQVTFRATDNCGGAVYSFTGSITGTQMAGTWSQPAAPTCSRGASGTFTATRR